MEKQKCPRCKTIRLTTDFGIKRLNIPYKTCAVCRENNRKYVSKKCEHGIRKSYCKECGGGHLCEHEKRRSRCRECKGSEFCKHDRNKYDCVECDGASICEHRRRRSLCKECEGSGMCEHRVQRHKCKECGGSSICEHNKVRSRCVDCGGGEICEHSQRRHRCVECNGSSICEHRRRRDICKVCDPIGHLSDIVRTHVYLSLTTSKEFPSGKYLGCDTETFRGYLEEQFEEGMNWGNYGKEWHVDHNVPLKYENPTKDELIERLHYTNTQPMWAPENISKGNRYIGKYQT